MATEPIFSKTKEWEMYGETMLAGWYFWDETWCHCHGPFSTRDECNTILNRYVEKFLK
jgi:hypothetical protein